MFYTDSSVALGYIRNEARRFRTYVAKRVQQIRDRSDPKQWHYVFSSDNPAYIASRGITVKQLSENKLWFKGPDFLWRNHVSVVNHDPVSDLSSEDTEVKKCEASTLISKHVVPLRKEAKLYPKVLEVERFDLSSALNHMQRSIVLIQRMIERNRPNKQHNNRPVAGPPTVEEMCLAEDVILKSLQFGYFNEEI